MNGQTEHVVFDMNNFLQPCHMVVLFLLVCIPARILLKLSVINDKTIISNLLLLKKTPLLTWSSLSRSSSYIWSSKPF